MEKSESEMENSEIDFEKSEICLENSEADLQNLYTNSDLHHRALLKFIIRLRCGIGTQICFCVITNSFQEIPL